MASKGRRIPKGVVIAVTLGGVEVGPVAIDCSRAVEIAATEAGIPNEVGVAGAESSIHIAAITVGLTCAVYFTLPSGGIPQNAVVAVALCLI